MHPEDCEKLGNRAKVTMILVHAEDDLTAALPVRHLAGHLLHLHPALACVGQAG